MGFIAPLFAQYPLGEKYTEWLYGDPQSNPYWDQPDKWASQSAMIATQNRAVVQSNLAYTVINGPVVQEFNLAGGRNCVVFARYAAITYNQSGAAPPPTPNQQLPNQLYYYALIGQRTVEGYREIDDGTPIGNVFGIQPWPHRFPVPMMWNDKIRRTLTFEYIDATGANIDVQLVWQVAWLNTGA